MHSVPAACSVSGAGQRLDSGGTDTLEKKYFFFLSPLAAKRLTLKLNVL